MLCGPGRRRWESRGGRTYESTHPVTLRTVADRGDLRPAARQRARRGAARLRHPAERPHPRARGVARPASRSLPSRPAARSSATCTTAPSSASPPSPSTSAARPGCGTRTHPRPAGSCTACRASSRRPSASCATWRTASTRRCSASVAWSGRCRRRPAARSCRAPSTCRRLGRHSPSVEAAVYFCCTEAIHNADRHSGGSIITVQASDDEGPGPWAAVQRHRRRARVRPGGGALDPRADRHARPDPGGRWRAADRSPRRVVAPPSRATSPPAPVSRGDRDPSEPAGSGRPSTY